MTEETLLNQFIGETFSKLSKEDLSLFSFMWTLYIARLGTGGDVGNYYSVEMGNRWYNIDFKITIKEKMTEEQMEALEEMYGFDFKKAVERFKEAGIIEDDKND